MQEDQSRLARELRKETCPRRVLDEVERRISAHEPSLGRLRYAIPVVVVLVLVCCLSLWRWQAGQHLRPQATSAERTTLERIRIAGQAEGALELVGSVLLRAGTHSERVISDRAVPPLRNSLEITKNKIIHDLEL